jgi:hypothetical protein
MNAEAAMGNKEPTSESNDTAMMNIFRSLTKVLKDNNQHLQSSNVTDPTKFNGLDTQWDDFYLQLRTCLLLFVFALCLCPLSLPFACSLPFAFVLASLPSPLPLPFPLSFRLRP